jgi:hypothetical protein
MYCGVCGAESTHGLNYCKRCGSTLNPPLTAPVQGSRTRNSVSGSVWAIALATVIVGLGGLGIVFNHARELVRPLYPGSTAQEFAPIVALVMVVFGSASVFGIVALLLRLFYRLLGIPFGSQRFGSESRPNYRPSPIPGAASVVSSVTEQTTRNFDPAIYRNSQS